MSCPRRAFWLWSAAVKLSLLLDNQAEGASQLGAAVRERFAQPDEVLGEVEVEVLELPDGSFDAQRAALGEATGEQIASLAAGAGVDDLIAVLYARKQTHDNEVTAAFQESRLSGAARYRRLLHRLLCRLGGRRSPPDPRGTTWVFDRRWVPAVVQVPASSGLDVPVVLAALNVRWERVWGAARATAPVLPLVAALKHGWQRLLLVGGALELGLLVAVGFYGLSGVLAMLGSQSSWAAKGIAGLALGAVTTLSFGILQFLARRRLGPALRIGSDVREKLLAPPGWNSN